jgi:hypothetical protein
MAVADLPPQDSKSTTGSPNDMTGLGVAATIDAPQENAKGTELKLEARSVKSIEHAKNICTAMEYNNRTRCARTSDIQSMHDGAPPRSGNALAQKAQAWQSNASTNWLSGIVGRQSQRFVNAIISQIYCTFSRLPESYADSKSKSDFMQAKFTQLMRGWSGYTGIINSLSVEDVLQGYTYGVFLDPYTWKPTMFKQNRFFCQEGAGQHAREQQLNVAMMDYRLDEFLDLIKDQEAAESNGYNLDNCVYAANHASVMDPRQDATTTQFRKIPELINEGVLGVSYTNTGARVVKTWLMWNREYDGQVSFWLIDRDSGKLLRFSFKLFPSMEDFLAMFSFEPGNGCIHSSKGLGRKLMTLAYMKELFRNGIVDNSRMAGLLLLQMDSKDRQQQALVVNAPFMMVPKSATIPQAQFTVSGDSYKIIDQLIDSWAEQAVGAYIAQQLNDAGTPEKTATQATIDAKREQEAADIQIRRWLDQMATMTQIQQSRAYCETAIKEAFRIYEKITKDPEESTPEIYEGHANIDPEVLRSLVEIFQFGITEEEVEVWRDSPASIFAHVSDAAGQQGVSAAYALFKDDPNFNQPLFKSKVAEGMMGAQTTTELFVPSADETILAEASRQQLSEIVTMNTLFQQPSVSPRDNHIVHGNVVKDTLTKLAPILSTNPNPPPDFMKKIELLLNHLGAHLAMVAKQGKEQDPGIKELNKFYEAFKKDLTQVVQIQAEAKVAHAAVVQKIAAEGLPADAVAPAPSPAAAPSPAPAPVSPLPGDPTPLAAAA